MGSLYLFLTLSPDDITAWAETVIVYLLAVASAVIALATVLLRFINFSTPIVEELYAREGAGEWRPKFWSAWDKATWAIQRISGAGHLTRQTTIHAVRRAATQTKENRLK